MYHPTHAGFHDATTSFAILVCASLILGVIFIPKLHTIIRRGQTGKGGKTGSSLYRSNSSSSLYSHRDGINPFYGGGRSHQHQLLNSRQRKKLGKMAAAAHQQYGYAPGAPGAYYR